MYITKNGKSLKVSGEQPKIGKPAPAFALENLDDQTIRATDFLGTPVLISVVPDLNTRVCSIQTKHFNHVVGQKSDVQLITISNNTKEEQKNWCAAQGVTMEMLHDTAHAFGDAYGVYIPEIDHLARAIFILDQNGQLVYKEIVPELTDEPNYEAALEKITALQA